VLDWSGPTLRCWARGPRHASSDHGALARSCTHRKTPAEGAETVFHVLEASAFDAFGLESNAIVLDLEADLVAVLEQRHGMRGFGPPCLVAF
jgi:hypothetical protein